MASQTLAMAEIGAQAGAMLGKCHICEELKQVEFCGFCEHYFCAECTDRLGLRSAEAVKAWVLGSELDCCGPLAQVA